jgi:hypothetical protein
MELLSGSSFTTRREAVEAIPAAGDFSALAGMDVFLVDLDVAVPVAIVPWYADEVERAVGEAAGDDPEPTPTADDALSLEVGADQRDVPAENEELAHDFEEDDEIASPPDDGRAPMVFDMGARLGLVQIDIDEWTCEDCIYVSTCAFSGTRRPAGCGAFQWRA